MSDCESCGGNSGSSEDVSLPVETDTVVTEAASEGCTNTTTTVTKNVTCSTIKDECHDCAVSPAPYPKLTLSKTIAMPECGISNAVDAYFDENISNIPVGLILYAEDTAGKTIRLKVSSVEGTSRLKVYNPCTSGCLSTKPVGEAIVATTIFMFGSPSCSTSDGTTSSTTTTNCLVGTFFFPPSGESNPANVATASNFNVGGLYSLAGFIWKVKARNNATQIELENPAPGNGS